MTDYRYTSRGVPPDGAGQYNQFAEVLQLNRFDADGADIEADLFGATDVPMRFEDGNGVSVAVVSLIDYAGNGHIRLNGAGWNYVHDLNADDGGLRVTDLSDGIAGGGTWDAVVLGAGVGAAVLSPQVGAKVLPGGAWTVARR